MKKIYYLNNEQIELSEENFRPAYSEDSYNDIKLLCNGTLNSEEQIAVLERLFKRESEINITRTGQVIPFGNFACSLYWFRLRWRYNPDKIVKEYLEDLFKEKLN